MRIEESGKVWEIDGVGGIGGTGVLERRAEQVVMAATRGEDYGEEVEEVSVVSSCLLPGVGELGITMGRDELRTLRRCSGMAKLQGRDREDQYFRYAYQARPSSSGMKRKNRETY